MKLQDMNTEQLTETLLTLTGPLCVIASDPDMTKALHTLGEMRGVPVIRAAAQAMDDLLPLLAVRHREETLAVLCALTGKTREAMLQQNGLMTARDIVESLDGELLRFFHSAASMAPGASAAC